MRPKPKGQKITNRKAKKLNTSLNSKAENDHKAESNEYVLHIILIYRICLENLSLDIIYVTGGRLQWFSLMFRIFSLLVFIYFAFWFCSMILVNK